MDYARRPKIVQPARRKLSNVALRALSGLAPTTHAAMRPAGDSGVVGYPRPIVRPFRSSVSAPLALAAALVATTGCGKKTDECNELAALINTNSAAMDEVFARSTSDRESTEANYAEIAELAEAISEALRERTLRTPDLATHAKAYADAASEIAQTYREASAILHRAATREAELETAGGSL